MAEQYELWLDESGDFINERGKRNRNMKSSLIGGILIESSNAQRAVNEIVIPTQLSHATELTAEEKHNHVLPTLERLQRDYGARQVFFENALFEEGEGDNPSKSLYLRMMAEGLLQLLLTLDATQDDIKLDVFIAQRSIEVSTCRTETINANEYNQYLKNLIEEKKKNRKIVFSSGTSINYKKDMAQASKKLQMADFACNTRLTRDSAAYDDEGYRSRINALHADAHIFYLHELNSTNYIKRCLVENRMTDAVMEILTTDDPIDIHKAMNLVTTKMSTVGYRIQKSQMKDISACLIAYADKQDRYEEEEAILDKIWTKVIPEFEDSNIPCGHLKFTVLLILSDVYLKEGDIISARKTVEEVKKAQTELGDCIEELFSLYQVKEKEALLCIKEFDYKKAKEIMEEVCDLFRKFMGFINSAEEINGRFKSPVSEYYGDALCMLLHTMMFMQRENSEMYDECCRLSDEAIKQYPKNPGELELHRKYRCHFEIEKGNCQKAIEMLALAKEIEMKEVNKSSLKDFLEKVSNTEEDDGAINYLMYYLLIMCEAKRREDSLAKLLEDALFENEVLLRVTGIIEKRDSSYNNVVDIRSVINTKDKKEYHPREIVYWKLGSYYLLDKKYDKAFMYLISADGLCDKSKDYSAMRIIGTVIKAELIYCLRKKNAPSAQIKMHINSLEKSFEELLNQDLQPATISYIERIKNSYISAGIDGTVVKEPLDEEKLLNISRLLGY